MLDEEQWRDVPDFPGYQASTFGRIKSFAKIVPFSKGGFKIYLETILAVWVTDKGYHTVTLCRDKKRYSKRVNRIIALTWLPNPEKYATVNHIDGIKANNNIHNLEWCTQAYNNKHSIETGLNNNYGENHHCAKLSEKDILEIRSLVKKYNQSELGRMFGVTSNQIGYIVKRKQWKRI